MKQLCCIFSFLFVSIASFCQSLPDSIFNTQTQINDIAFLASDKLQGRLAGSPGADSAAVYIATRFKEIGLKPLSINPGFNDPVGISIGNIVGAIPGKSRENEIVIFSAHYDHIGVLNNGADDLQTHARAVVKGDNVFNGANDNASGIALLLMLAEYLVKENNNERTIMFCAFTGEEQGFIGSTSFADKIVKPELIKAVVNFDMVGIPASKNAGAFLIGRNTSAAIRLLNNTLEKTEENYGRKYFTESFLPPGFSNDRSDHVPFETLGIYAFTIIATTDSNKYYHTINDNPNTLDYPFLLKLTKAVAIAIKPLLADAELN